MNKYAVTALILICIILAGFALAGADSIAGAPNSWRTRASLPKAGGSSAAVLNGTIYTMSISGTYTSGTWNGTAYNYAYNPVTDSWSSLAPMPTLKTGFTMATCNNKIYVIGGGDPRYVGPNNAVNEVYDPSTNTWATKAPMPIGTSGTQANTVNGKIYVVGGTILTLSLSPTPVPTLSPAPTPTTSPPASIPVPTPTATATLPYTWIPSTVNFTQIYDPATDSWTMGAPIPYPVESYASAVVDNRIYVIGGQDMYNLPDINVAFTQIYDPATDSWSLGAPIPVGTWQAAAGATTGAEAPKRIYVVGGSGGFGVGLNQNYAYDPAANTWTNAAPMPTERFNPTVAVVDDVLYVIGGGQGLASLATNEQYTPIGYVAPSPTPASLPLSTPATSPSIPEFPSWRIEMLGVAAAFAAVVVVWRKKKQKT